MEMRNETIKTIYARRAVRDFMAEKQLPDEDLRVILEAGRMAPSAMNLQPWHFTVVQNKILLDALSEEAAKIMREREYTHAKDPFFHAFYHAPTVVFVLGEITSAFAQTDCALASENMMLAAASIGIDSCYVVSFTLLFEDINNAQQYLSRLQVPQGYEVKGAVLLGYRSEEGKDLPVPPRKKEIVTLIK